jgi:hypothetical protein
MLYNFNPENGNGWKLMWFYFALKSVENSFSFHFLPTDHLLPAKKIQIPGDVTPY